jgi:protein required for attachment to host cells
VQQARVLARERNIEAKIRADTESERLAREARDLLARAAEAEAQAASETEALTIAHQRVAKELELAAAAAAREDTALVEAVILDPANVDMMRRHLTAALDFFHLRSRLRGASTGHVQSLVAEAIGGAGGLSGEAMWARGSALFERTLADVRRRGAQG